MNALGYIGDEHETEMGNTLFTYIQDFDPTVKYSEVSTM